MNLDDIIPGLPVRARGDGGLGGGPGVMVGVVERLDGEYVQLRAYSNHGHGASAEQAAELRWVPLAWVDRMQDSVLTLNRTAREVADGALRARPGAPQDASTPPS